MLLFNYRLFNRRFNMVSSVLNSLNQGCVNNNAFLSLCKSDIDNSKVLEASIQTFHNVLPNIKDSTNDYSFVHKQVDQNSKPTFKACIEHWTPGPGEVGHLAFSLKKSETSGNAGVQESVDHVGLWPESNPKGFLEKINSFINNKVFPIGTPHSAKLYNTLKGDIDREDGISPSHIKEIELTEHEYKVIKGNIDTIKEKDENGNLMYSLFPRIARFTIGLTKPDVYNAFSEDPFSGVWAEDDLVDGNIENKNLEVHHCTTIVNRLLDGTSHKQPENSIAPWIASPGDYYEGVNGKVVKAENKTSTQKLEEEIEDRFENNDI